jgi:Family of unknown function (DUF6922)
MRRRGAATTSSSNPRRKPTRYTVLMLPQKLRPLFWNINTDTFDPVAYPEYTISHVLEYGFSNEKAVLWLKETFSAAQIIDVIRTEERFSPEVAKRWAEAYHIPLDQVAALRPPAGPSAPVRRFHL